MNRLTVGIFIFENVEVLDFAGPYEVFSRTRMDSGPASRRSDESAPFNVFTVAATRETVSATGGLKVVPDFGFDDAPQIDILVVPGGFGARPLLDDAETIDWIRRVAGAAQYTTSVCTGSLLLAKAGLLKGKRATTHWGALDTLREIDSSIIVDEDARSVNDGIISSAGVSAGIDMAFSVVEMLHGKDVADETAHYINYLRKAAV